ncbi:hypothetical protein L484_017270 [Morus notabilis]|uniref:Uncharacterized protein n=1 Tax=Morus notabilis TaxID=981085 RepID=W9S3C0_9ROSA|nr:hypothetical protein L484_017270 [Morus notabilis]
MSHRQRQGLAQTAAPNRAKNAQEQPWVGTGGRMHVPAVRPRGPCSRPDIAERAQLAGSAQLHHSLC